MKIEVETTVIYRDSYDTENDYEATIAGFEDLGWQNVFQEWSSGHNGFAVLIRRNYVDEQ